MPLTVTILDAAHKYGIDNYANSNAAYANRIGVIANSFASWGDRALYNGETGIITANFTGGFTYKMTLTSLDGYNLRVSALQLLKTETSEILVNAIGAVGFNSANIGMAFTPSVTHSGNDSITGNSFNNVLQGWGGNDRIDGGAGIDTAVFSGLRSQYSISKSGTTFTVVGPDGADTLLNIERLQFDDVAYATDTAGPAGQAYRLYKAAFDRAPDMVGLGFHISNLDAGASPEAVALSFVNSSEFATKYGALSNSAFVTQLYQNVLHRGPDGTGQAYWSSLLDQGLLSRAGTLASFAESPENQAAVIGSISNGIAYSPYG